MDFYPYTTCSQNKSYHHVLEKCTKTTSKMEIISQLHQKEPEHVLNYITV